MADVSRNGELLDLLRSVTDVLRGGPDLQRASPPSTDFCTPPPPPTSSGARPSYASCAISGPGRAGRTPWQTTRTAAMTRGPPTVSWRTWTTIVPGLSTTLASVAPSDARFCLWCLLACFSWCLVCTVTLLLISAMRLPNKTRPQSMALSHSSEHTCLSNILLACLSIPNQARCNKKEYTDCFMRVLS